MAREEHTHSCAGALSRKLAQYVQNSELSDITLKFGQKVFPAHRLILGSWSEQLAKKMESASDGILVLHADATEEETKSFENILHYLYTGEITFTTANFEMVMSLSGKLGLTGLEEMSLQWVRDAIHQGGTVGAFHWLKFSRNHHLHSLTDHCLHALALYFRHIPEASWLTLSVDDACAILDHDQLVAEDEEDIIKRVDAWLAAKGSVKENEELFKELSKRIKLPFLEVSKLLKLQEQSPIVKFLSQSNPEAISDALKFRALSFESTAADQRNDRASDDITRSLLKNIDTTPRLYLNFRAPGSVQHPSRSHKQSIQFRGNNTHAAYIPYMVLNENSYLENTGNDQLHFNVTLETKEAGNVTTWLVKYTLTETPRLPWRDYKCKIVLETKPHPQDTDFYLPDHAIVTTHDKVHVLYRSIVIQTPPIFAGRKPQGVELAGFAYFKKTSHT